MMESMRAIVLIGPMAAGKTTVGSALAHRLERAFFDSDDIIERTTGRRASNIADHEGVHHLHDIESLILEKAISRPRGAVIAAAASVVDRPHLVERLRTGREFVALLMATREECERRSQGTDSHRRTIDDEESYELFARRMDAYRRAADVEIDTSRLDPDEVTDIVVNTLWVSWP
jgi:shikimate kinase